jgi:Concanavalin A-like lectin/glucanases superfamily/Secretion system C-terminal sorting domain
MKRTLTRRTTLKTALLISLSFLICNVALAQTVPAYVSTNALLGWYPFSGNATNAFGTGKNGSVMGPVLTADRFGTVNSAYHFDGNLDHIVIDTFFFNNGWSNYSVSWWLKSDTLDNFNNFNNSQESFNTIPHNGVGVSFNWGHTGKYNIYVNSNPAIATWDIIGGGKTHDSARAHVWKHMVFTKQDDTVYSFYINGVLDTTCHRTLTASNYYCKFLFGNIDSSRGDEGFMGTLDDYGIWNRSLAACEVRRLYNSNAFSYLTSQPSSVSAAPGSTVTFTVIDTGSGLTRQWQENSGTGYVNLTNTGIYSGVTTNILTLTGVTSAMNNYKYRCVVGGAYTCVDTSGFGKLTLWPTAINNVSGNSKISIAPNPTSGEITITGAGKVDVKIYNSVGQLVQEVNQADKISIAELPAGVYLIKLMDEKGIVVYFDKVLKQ